jgi:hypothetical protein
MPAQNTPYQRRTTRTLLVFLQLIIFTSYILAPVAIRADDPTPDPAAEEEATSTPEPSEEPAPTEEPGPAAEPAPLGPPSVWTSKDDYAPSDRYNAWRDAICDVYVHVDVKAADPDRYRGFIREASFGDVVLTDILLSEQHIRRNKRHISRLDKECYYLQLIHKGSISVVQRGEMHKSNAARGAVFCAAEQYELHGHGEVRSFYLEIPRDEFAQRFPRERIPVSASLNTTQGLGRIATEFCATLATEGSRLEDSVRAGLGNQLMDLLAF